MKVYELFEDDGQPHQAGKVVHDKKLGKWAATNKQGVTQYCDDEETAHVFAGLTPPSTISDESVGYRGDMIAESAMKKLKDNKKPLTPEERKQIMDAGAVWHHGPNGEETPAIWKSVDKNGKVTYVTNTHRAYQTAPTVKGAIKKYAFIKTTA